MKRPPSTPDTRGARQTACADCALQPFCSAADQVPQGLPAVCGRKRLERGDALFQVGDPQHSVYAVRAGFLKLSSPVTGAGEHIVRFLLPGDAVGLEGFGPRKHVVGAVALEDCEVCEMSLPRALALAESSPAVDEHLRRLLAGELAQAQAHAAALAHQSAPQRMAAFLLELSSRWGARGFSPHAFRLPMDRREIADSLGLTIETVSRLLSEFRERGWANVEGREVTILDAQGLKECPRIL